MSSTEPEVGKRCESAACIKLDVYVGDHLAEPLVRFHSTETGTVMQARASEVIKFFAEVRNNEWDHVIADLEFALARQAAAKMTFTAEEREGVNFLVDAAEHKAR